jgi:hypothetical protein
MKPFSKGERLSETIVKPRSLGFPSLAKLVRNWEEVDGGEKCLSLIVGSNHNAESALTLKVILAGQEKLQAGIYV